MKIDDERIWAVRFGYDPDFWLGFLEFVTTQHLRAPYWELVTLRVPE